MRRRSAIALRAFLLLAGTVISFGLAMIGVRLPPLYWLIALGAAYKFGRRWKGSAWSHGSARLATVTDLVRNNLLGHEGLILGTTGYTPKPSRRAGVAALLSRSTPSEAAVIQFLSAFGSRWACERRIRIKKFVHLATFAATGRGKGIYALIPNLLTYAGSCVVTDPKGELHTITSAHRQRKFRHRVLRLDPFAVCGPGADTFNPLLFIDADAIDFLDQCRDLANMLVVRKGTETDPYWDDAAELVITAFIAYVCACENEPAERTLFLVRDLLASRTSYEKALAAMQRTEAYGGVIQRLGGLLTWFQDKNLSSVLTVVQRHTAFLDSPAVGLSTASSSFDPRLLRSAGRATLYLCLPHDKLGTLAPLMRLWVGMIIRIITRGVPDEKNPVLFFLDEAAHIGKVRVLEDAVTLMRGMGIRLWFCFQSPAQLHECYGDKATTILDNIETQQYFGMTGYFSCDEISKRIGDATITTVSGGGSSNRSHNTGGTGPPSGSVSFGNSVNYSDTGRRLIKPEEIMQLPDDAALICHRNVPVIPAKLVPYFVDPEFSGGKAARGWKLPAGWFTAVLVAAVAVMTAIAVIRTIAGEWEPRSPIDSWNVPTTFPSP